MRVVVRSGQPQAQGEGMSAYCNRMERVSAENARDMFLTHGTLPHDARPK